ncbi:MAG: hypothetical protein AAGA54_34925 [Myxococcota bacterium]
MTPNTGSCCAAQRARLETCVPTKPNLSPDKLERFARRLYRRWVRAGAFALEYCVVAASMRFGIEERRLRYVVEDLRNGRAGLVRLLARARRTARSRLRGDIEAAVIQLAHTFPHHSVVRLTKDVRHAGYNIGRTTVMRILKRCGVQRAS